MTFYSYFYIIGKNKIEREKNTFGRVLEGLLKVYTYSIYAFSKEAEMVLSRILGDDMCLFPFRFLITKGGRVKPANHFNKFFVVNLLIFGFHRAIISTLQIIRVCDYLFLSSLLSRFSIVGCRSIPLIIIGGELNDFNE